MGNVYYAEGESRAGKVRDLFGTIARRYDLLNDLQSLGLHRCWKRRLVRMSGVRAGERALDLCCGTGDITLRLARAGAVSLGLDFSQPMLAEAQRREKALQVQGGSAGFCQGDALHLPFAGESFDVVTMGYGLRNLADWRLGLEEMWRVLTPGGRLLILEFGRPRHTIWRLFYFAYLKCVVPLMGRLFCGDAQAYAYILESLRHYPGQEGVAEKMRALSGVAGVEVLDLVGGTMSIHCARKQIQG